MNLFTQYNIINDHHHQIHNGLCNSHSPCSSESSINSLSSSSSTFQSDDNISKLFVSHQNDINGVDNDNNFLLNTSLNESVITLDDLSKLPLNYTLVEIVVATCAFAGNLLAILVFIFDKRLRKVTNFYIISLSCADLLVGLVGVPSAILTKIGLPKNDFNGCLTMLSLLVVLCTISILNLVAVSLDRFWAILYPLNYHSQMSSRAARIIIISCWILGALVGFLPLFGWNQGKKGPECYFLRIMDYGFLVFLFFATIVFPAFIMLFVYLRIYLVVVNHSSLFDQKDSCKSDGSSKISNGDRVVYTIETSDTDSDFRMTESKVSSFNRREVKKARKLAMIVAFFMICWIPLYLSNTIMAFSKESIKTPLWLLDTLIIMSHLNSAINPLLYAYHMKDFREAMKNFLCKCLHRPRGLRDLRRQELRGVSQKHLTSNSTSTSNSKSAWPADKPLNFNPSNPHCRR
ncbi:adenosine receptor A2b-like isoform X1 [Brevipalpus obovatus]|uniref:adenosine receptor A2b-like isoform X1 n=1 Tax=Brevipalpus obovatus TaxID=246614 RepID=UPI003D9E32E6